MNFYKPSTIINSFRSSGIYPVSREAVPNDRLKPSLTYDKAVSEHSKEPPGKGFSKPVSKCSDSSKVTESRNAEELLKMYSEVLGTPVRDRYDEKLNAMDELNDCSPGIILYKKLKDSAGLNTEKRENEDPSSTIKTALCSEDQTISTPVCKEESQHPCVQDSVIDMTLTGLHILANAAEQVFCQEGARDNKSYENDKEEGTYPNVSPILQEITKLPHADPPKEKAPRLLDTLPDAVSSREAIRKMALASLKTAREKAEKEIKAKARYLKTVGEKAEKDSKAKTRYLKSREKAEKESKTKSRTAREKVETQIKVKASTAKEKVETEIKAKARTAREKVEREIKAKAGTAREKLIKEIEAKAETITCLFHMKKQSKRRTYAAPKNSRNKRTVANKTKQTVGNNCQVCLGTEEEDQNAGIETTWLQCDRCDRWVHSHCLPVNFEFDYGVFVPDSLVEFTCHNCSNK